MRLPWPRVEDSARSRLRTDAVSLLTFYLLLLIALPSTLKVAPLRGLGAPALVFGLGLAGLWAYYQCQRTQPTEAGTQPVRTAYFGVVTCLCLSFVVAMTRPIDSSEVNAAVVGLLTVASWGGVLLVANDGIASRDRQLTMIRRLVIAGAALAAVGILQFVTGERWVDRISIPGMTNADVGDLIGTRSGFNRPAGTAMHPIEFGYVITTILPLALNLAIVDTSRPAVRRVVPIALMGFSVVTSISRSALICAVIGTVIAAAAWPRSVRWTAVAVSPLIAIGVFVTIPGLLGTVLGLFTGIADDSSAQSRTSSYAIAGGFIERSPLLGRGYGTFTPAYRILDNGYLLLLIEVGIVGLLSVLCLIITGMACALRARTDGVENRLLGQALCGALAAAGAGLALFDGLSFPMAGSTLFLVLGVAGAQWRLVRGEAPQGTSDTTRAQH